MVFLRSIGSSKSVWLDTNSIKVVENWISNVQGVPLDNVTLYFNGRKVDSAVGDVIGVDSTVEAVLALPGGKGGFGSMLRSIGAQIEKTTNREACRDLSGRRLRDVNEEARLRRYVQQQAERERQAEEKKKAKLEKLRKFVTEGESKHEFFDPTYDKARETATERVHEAVEQAFSEPKPSTSGAKRKADGSSAAASSSASASTSAPASTSGASKPKALWIGVDLNDSDLDSSSDDDEEVTPPKKCKPVVAVN